MSPFYKREKYYRAAALPGEPPSVETAPMTIMFPTWYLTEPGGCDRYVPANNTDIRKAFERARTAITTKERP